MTLDLKKSETYWLENFFSANNQLHWHQIVDETAPVEWLVQVKPWIELFKKSRGNCPIVLPVFDGSGPDVWYGMAPTNNIMGQLMDEIVAFVGPSYSDFRGELCELSEENVSERALLERFGSRVVCFQANLPEDKIEIERRMKLFQSVLSRRPEIPDRSRRPFGKIRGDFDRAILVGNEIGAKSYIEELVDTGRVNAEQKKCLEIRLLSGLGRQEELARDRILIQSVMDLSLPPQTISDVVEALYETYLRPVEKSTNQQQIKELFKNSIARNYGPLFKERKGIVIPEVLRAFLLYELTQDEPNISRCNTIVSAHSKDDEGFLIAESWLNNASQSFQTRPELGALEIARQAIADEDYSVALEQSYIALPDPWAFSALLRCAVELRSDSITKRVLETIQETNKESQLLLTEKDKSRLEQLKDSQNVVSLPNYEENWVTWAQWIEGGDNLELPITVLDKMLPKWSIDDYVNNTVICEQFVKLIGNASEKPEEIYRMALPLIVDFFVERPQKPLRCFASIYAILIKVIAWSGPCSTDELELVTSLSESLLSVGCSPEMYSEALEDISEVIIANNSPLNLDWALNTAEIIVLYPNQEPEKSLRLFMNVVDMARTTAHRLTLAQKTILELLAKDYGCHNLIESFPQLDKTTDLEVSEKTFEGMIGIYSLTVAAAKRAKDILNKSFPKARIEINSDCVKTTALTHLARNADIFVFAWKSSKHSAFDGVKQERKTEDILLPTGKGSASIVSSVMDYVTTL